MVGTRGKSNQANNPTSDNTMQISRSDFSDDFFFGAGSSAYQIEGAADEYGKGLNNWDVFTERNPGRVVDGSNGIVAIDGYHLYKEDVKIMKNMGLNAYRLSISWSRVLPSGKLSGGVNKEGIKYYNDLIDELLANDIEPFVTLFHFDLPQTLQDEYGGFLSSQIIDDFSDYAEVCFWEFGDRVKHWITLNEPWTYTVGGYANGGFPPGRGGTTSPEQSQGTLPNSRCSGSTSQGSSSNGDPGTEPYIVTHHLLLAHAAAVDLYKMKFQAAQKGKIGIVLVSQWMEPLSDSAVDKEASLRGLDFVLGWYLAPLSTGDYPQRMRDIVKQRLPQFSAEQSQKLKGSFDFLGINYYTANYVTNAPDSGDNGSFSYSTDQHVTSSSERDGKPIGPQGGSTWLYSYPEGLQKLLVYVKKTYDVPLIYVTENGFDEVNNPALTLSQARHDNPRIQYHKQHLYYLKQAIKDGVNVKGYFVWALMDNFEWASGYTVRFGLVYIDYKNKLARYPKDSAIWLMGFLKNEQLIKLPPKRPMEEAKGDNSSSKKLKK